MISLIAAVPCMLLLMGAGVDTANAITEPETTQELLAASDSAAALDEMLQGQEEVPADVPLDVVVEPAFLTVDGVPVEAHYTLYQDETTYLSVVDFVAAVAPAGQVTWTGNGVTVQTEQLTLTAEIGEKYVVANGRYLYAEDGVLLYEDSTMLPATVLAKAFDAQLAWDSTTGTLAVYTGSGALESGDTVYEEDAVYWLSHIIYAESGNQPLSGKIAVGNVIMNRVESPLFPNTIYTVIFQKNQFSPVSSGSIYRDPNEESVIAAKLVLDGAEALDDVLFFNRSGLNCWASRNKDLVAVIGDHAFYA